MSSFNTLRFRRMMVALLLMSVASAYGIYIGFQEQSAMNEQNMGRHTTDDTGVRAMDALEQLHVKGRAPKTGYSRALFGDGWQTYGDCTTRELILQRDLHDAVVKECKVQSGILDDPYTAKSIRFTRGPDTSDDIQIDHVVALSDAWQKGAQQLSQSEREALANDPLELLAVDGPANQDKGDGDAATWLPPYKPYRCKYVARQIAVKRKYKLWVTSAEKSAMKVVLAQCPAQTLPH